MVCRPDIPLLLFSACPSPRDKVLQRNRPAEKLAAATDPPPDLKQVRRRPSAANLDSDAIRFADLERVDHRTECLVVLAFMLKHHVVLKARRHWQIIPD